jgi:hypothetical protein
MDWTKVDEKLKSSEERKAEAETWAKEEEAGIRRIAQEFATRFETDLHTLNTRLASKLGTRVTLNFGSFTRIVVDDLSLSLGFKMADNGLSFTFFVDGAEQVVVFTRQPTFKHWECQGDSTHKAVNVVGHFESLLDSFVDRVRKLLPP